MRPSPRSAAAAALIAAAFLSGCGLFFPESEYPCRGETLTETSLYFGLSGPYGPITPAQFDSFVEREVTGRIPDGFTIMPASGAWRGPKGQAYREESRVLIWLHPPGGASEPALDTIIARYKSMFSQDAVLRVDRPVCATF